jgi:putative endonuclease
VLLRKQEPRTEAVSDAARLCLHHGKPPERHIVLGVTSNLPQRVYQHRNGLIDGFSKRYGCRTLVWYEAHDDIQDARARELQMKKWKRAWKLEAIEGMNLEWRDLVEEIAR